jgi:phosphomethylpyrimidine synthase
MTQLELARNNKLTSLVKRIAKDEGVPARGILKLIAAGKVVIPLNKTHKIKKPCAIGRGLKTKVNANIGTSPDKSEISDELKKLAVAVKYGTDTVMDLSVGGDLKRIRKQILRHSPVPVGTVPVYEIAVNAQKRKNNFLKFNIDDVLGVLESQAKEGVDFFTIHAGVTRKSLKALRQSRRTLDIVSRGGAMIAGWMSYHKKENPFFEYFDEILDIAYKYDVTISLGDGLRPGSVLDATDRAQIAELKILGELASLAAKDDVQVMIEGPGHVPLHQIEENIKL